MAGIDITTLPRSRADAIALGSKHYFTGKPCKNGHVEPRYFMGQCLGCKRDISSEWSASNQEWVKAYSKRWSQSESGKISSKKSVARWNSADPIRAWATASVAAAKRRAKEKGLDFSLDYKFLMSIAPETCPATGRRLVYEAMERADRRRIVRR